MRYKLSVFGSAPEARYGYRKISPPNYVADVDTAAEALAIVADAVAALGPAARASVVRVVVEAAAEPAPFSLA